jgi:hypothetical protein
MLDEQCSVDARKAWSAAVPVRSRADGKKHRATRLMHPVATPAKSVSLPSSFPLRAAALGALIAALMASSLLWILADRRVWPWDQAWYGEVALDLWYARHGGLLAWASACLHAMGAKPPLLVWIGQFLVPFSHVTGDVEPALLLLNVAVAFATLVLIPVTLAGIGVGWCARTAAVLLCAGASLFIGMTHQFMVEMLQCLTVAAALLLAARARRMFRVRTASLIVIIASAAALTKASGLLFVAPFLACAAVAALFKKSRDPHLATADLILGLAAPLCAALAVAWYLVNWNEMLAHVLSSTTGDGALLYGSPPAVAKLSFWSRALALAIAPGPWIGISVAVLSGWALARALVEFPRASAQEWIAAAIDSSTLLAATITATTMAVVLVYSLQANEETRLLAPLLPMLAVLLGWSLGRINQSWMSALVVLVLAANAALGHLFAHGSNFLDMAPSVWLTMVDRSGQDRSMLASVVAATCPLQAKWRYTIVGVEYPALNAHSAAFYSAKARRAAGYRCRYASLGYAETDAECAFARIFALDAAYVITVRPDAQPPDDAFNRVSRAVAARLATDARFTLVPAATDMAVVYGRAPGSASER